MAATEQNDDGTKEFSSVAPKQASSNLSGGNKPKEDKDGYASNLVINNLSCADRMSGFCVNYTKENPSYQDLQPNEKMDYAVFMMRYNVEKNKEFAGGLEEVRGKSWEKMTLEFISNPQRLVNFMTFAAFGMVLVLVVIWLILHFLSMLTVDIKPTKKSTTIWLAITLGGLILLTFIIDFVYGRVLEALENLSSNIK
jgi:hypothetical protein